MRNFTELQLDACERKKESRFEDAQTGLVSLAEERHIRGVRKAPAHGSLLEHEPDVLPAPESGGPVPGCDSVVVTDKHSFISSLLRIDSALFFLKRRAALRLQLRSAFGPFPTDSSTPARTRTLTL